MRKKIGAWARYLAKLAGFQLSRISVSTNNELQLLTSFKKYGINLVLDVGANTGQFGGNLFEYGYDGRIISFEPLSDAYQKLNLNASKHENWEVHARCAIGSKIGIVEINVSENSYSSSILPMLDAHLDAAPKSTYVTSETVEIATLNRALKGRIQNQDRVFVKIDTQGFEWEVIEGATEILPLTTGILCEISLVPLYEGQKTWREIVDRLELEGFRLWAIQDGFINENTGQTLQIDAIFFRDVEV